MPGTAWQGRNPKDFRPCLKSLALNAGPELVMMLLKG